LTLKPLQIVALMLFAPMLGVSGNESISELYTCSFTAHTPVGDLNGKCTTQTLPALGFLARWAFTLTFDPQATVLASKIQPDSFYDMVRGQCLQDGSFTNVMPLWGDFIIQPDAPDYIVGLKSCTPDYQVAPNRVTLTLISTDPLIIQFLYEERPEDLDPNSGGPGQQWVIHYLESFRRLQQNRR
jgi:hypothetical protein